MRHSRILVAALLALLAPGLARGRAASDGWTPIIPEGVSAGRHSGAGALAVEPGLPGVLASLSGFHGHAYRPPRPPRPSLPSLPHPHPLSLSEAGDTCSLYKAAMTQDLYFQYIQYKVHMPDLKELTLCMWHKFYNHSSDHPLFSYATRDTPRALLAWVSATDRSTYFSMSVDGHTLYRLNYPLRLNRWYHSCQSWNGKTGEWQVWVNAERVGRGFHNLLVNHVIKGGGVAITGQEQRQLGGGFLEGEGAPKGAGGMLGEVTQLFMYSVALTAGKAYRDHKHHHGNYNADTAQQPRGTTTTTTPAPETTTLSPYAPFITNGQLTPELPIFELSAFRKNIPMPPMEEGAQQQQQQQHLALAAPGATATAAMLDLSQLLPAPGGAVSYLHMGGSPLRIPLLTHSHARPQLDLDPQQHYLFKRDDKSDSSASASTSSKAAVENKDEKQQQRPKRDADGKQDDADVMQAAAVEPQRIIKRQPQQSEEAKATSTKRDTKRSKSRNKPAKQPEAADSGTELSKAPAPAPAEEDAPGSSSDKKKKRQTLSLHGGPIELGGDVDTSLLTQGLSGLLPNGETLGAGSYSPGSYVEFHGNHHHHQQLIGLAAGPMGPMGLTGLAGLAGPPKKENRAPPLKKETEPAEGEVMAVMGVCSGCSPDPFAKVNIISWQGTPKKLYSGVLYLPAKPMCRKF